MTARKNWKAQLVHRTLFHVSSISRGEHTHNNVGIHRIPKLKVVVNNLRVHNGIPSCHAINFVHTRPCVAQYIRCDVHRHEAHDVVRFFHAADMEIDNIQLPWPCINCTNLTICKVCLDIVSLTKFWPVGLNLS